jgi:hypothetical protein
MEGRKGLNVHVGKVRHCANADSARLPSLAVTFSMIAILPV